MSVEGPSRIPTRRRAERTVTDQDEIGLNLKESPWVNGGQLRNGVLVHGEDSCGTCSRFARKSALDRSVTELDEIVAV
jgi:hypothetical protein